MRKLFLTFVVVGVFTLVLPSCSGNDDFTEVVETIDEQESSVEADEERVTSKPGDD